MALMIDEKNLKEGLLGLVVALVQIIQEALEHQALRRMEGGDLSQEEVERLGEALYQLDIALAKIIEDNGIEEGVASVREGLDDVASELVDRLVNPGRWEDHGR